jgi:DNA-binding IscR family transcriptional regulator
METPYLPHHCIKEYEECPMYGGCTFIGLWDKIDEAIRNVTDNITILDVMRGEKCRYTARRSLK